jgi:hypothetical protein
VLPTLENVDRKVPQLGECGRASIDIGLKILDDGANERVCTINQHDFAQLPIASSFHCRRLLIRGRLWVWDPAVLDLDIVHVGKSLGVGAVNLEEGPGIDDIERLVDLGLGLHL